MKNKKTIKIADSQILAKGIFKKTFWPWLLVIAAALTLAVFFALIAIEFFNAPRCQEHLCETFFAYSSHYSGVINVLLIVAAALVLVAILSAILFIRKRSLIVSTAALTYKRGRKVIHIPFESIQDIDIGASSITVTVPYNKFKFKKLKNRKEVYDTLFTRLNTSVTTTTTKTVISPYQSLTAMAAPLLENPTLEGKLAYFQKLHESGLITDKQYDKYVAQSRKADSEK
ncbi:MAG: hypothetical protein E7584_08355 [Ruminococcaceae bacterium]|nr:hypothetical protein [Oscillospiraceae bacterium]